MTSYQPNKTKIKVGLYFFQILLKSMSQILLAILLIFFKHFYLLLIGQSALHLKTNYMYKRKLLRKDKLHIFKKKQEQKLKKTPENVTQ